MDTPFHNVLRYLSLPGVFSKLPHQVGFHGWERLEVLGAVGFSEPGRKRFQCSFHSFYPVHGRLAVILACAYFSGLKAL